MNRLAKSFTLDKDNSPVPLAQTIGLADLFQDLANNSFR
jgi:hypothetical protein